MQFKELKQEVEHLFGKIQEQASEGDLPELEDVKQFARYCSLMQTRADEEWAEEMDDFMQLVHQLLQNVKNGNTEEIVQLLGSLEDTKNFCHRTFGV
ncbi:MAG: GAK system XXXCH domain-containing protein [Desulfohalobiaceae bacterium]|nr:GAK system XXXCH domain-containing protein [Desulfohalobiaceae bacterium]